MTPQEIIVKDKNGNEIKEFDVLKVFHFIGKRRKKHYMYKWVKKDPEYGYLVAHHPDSLTWRFLLSFDHRNRRLCWPKFGPSYSMGTKYRSPNGDEFSAWAELPLIGTFSFSTQKHMWK